MGYSVRDLEKASRNINEHFERKAEKRGEELANRIINSTSQGRGLWVIILWSTWVTIFIFSGSFIATGLKQLFSIEMPLSLIGLVAGFALAMNWYKWEYTIRHPFLSSMVGSFGTSIGVIFLLGKLGWW